MSEPIRLYHARCGWRCGNAGDECARDIVRHYTQRVVTVCDARDSPTLVAAGSIAQNLPASYSGAVWGTGLMFEHARVYAPGARVLAVRGQLTARRWEGLGKVAFGDPGILAADVYGVARTEPRYAVGLIPHYADADLEEVALWARAFPDDATTIDICGRPRDVLEQMSRCAFIISSSLHGLVFADSLGIPNAWVVLSDRVQGAGFKFRDYYSAHGIRDPMAVSFHRGARPSDIAARAWEYKRPMLAGMKVRLVVALEGMGEGDAR